MTVRTQQTRNRRTGVGGNIIEALRSPTVPADPCCPAKCCQAAVSDKARTQHTRTWATTSSVDWSTMPRLVAPPM